MILYMNIKLIIFICLLLLPTIYAGEGRTFELDFNVRDQYDLFLKKSDRILFEYGGYNNTIIIDEIKINTTELDIFLFLEKGLHTPDYQFLTKKYEIRLDFDKDGKREMSIGLIRNNLEDGVTYLLLKRLDGWDENAELDLSKWKTLDGEVKPNMLPYVLVVGAIIVLILIVLSFYYYNKRRGVYF